MNTLRRLLCALRGHDPLFAIDARGVHLQCGSCDYRSPGFNAQPARRIVRWWRFQRRLAS